jgi:hypothetical protein
MKKKKATPSGTKKRSSAKRAKRIVHVPLAKLDKVCRECGKVKESTVVRTYYAKNYTGPCADSFCYASCDSSSCRPVTRVICSDCEEKLKK